MNTLLSYNYFIYAYLRLNLIVLKSTPINSSKKELKMSFPFEFARSRGDYDIFSPVINFTGNATAVGVGGISLGAISYLALKTLGFSQMTTTVATAIPVIIRTVSIISAVVAGGFFIAVCMEIVKTRR